MEAFRMQYRYGIILILAILFFPSPSRSEAEYTVRIDRVTKDKYFIFEADKGEVRFNHTRHQAVMKAESCIPCHKTKTPTKAHTMTRFDQRAAHYFCKGCHREIGRGPVE